MRVPARVAKVVAMSDCVAIAIAIFLRDHLRYVAVCVLWRRVFGSLVVVSLSCRVAIIVGYFRPHTRLLVGRAGPHRGAALPLHTQRLRQGIRPVQRPHLPHAAPHRGACTNVLRTRVDRLNERFFRVYMSACVPRIPANRSFELAWSPISSVAVWQGQRVSRSPGTLGNVTQAKCRHGCKSSCASLPQSMTY